jgi:predicted phosphodiesterase
MLRVAIFSDVHGNLAALRATLAAIARQRPVQLTVAAGDLVAVGPRPAEALDLLVESGCALTLGNHEELLWQDDPDEVAGPFTALVHRQIPWLIGQLGDRRLDLLRRLPRRLRLSPAPGRDLLIVHASPSNELRGHAATPETGPDELRARYGGARARAIAFGHYHQPFVREWDEGLLVNVASVSLPKDGRPLAAYSILTWDGDDWAVEQHRVPYDTADEAVALAASDIPR